MKLFREVGLFFLKPFFLVNATFCVSLEINLMIIFLFLLLGSQREGVLGKYFFLFISIAIFNTVGNGKDLFAMKLIA